MVVAIIAILAAILLPALNKAKVAARKSSCANSLKQIGVAFQMYYNDYNESFPLYLNYYVPGGEFYYGLLARTGYIKSSAMRALITSCGKTRTVYKLPSPNTGSYVVNVPLTGQYPWTSQHTLHPPTLPPKKLKYPSRSLLLCDGPGNSSIIETYLQSDPLWTFYRVGPVHAGRANILYVDGHVNSYRTVPGLGFEEGAVVCTKPIANRVTWKMAK